jgi:hypothetical protein
MSALPPRKAVLFLLDPSTGKLYPVRLVVSADGSSAYLSISIDKDNIGLATEATLSAIKSQTDKLSFDEFNRLYIANPPNLDTRLTDVRDNLNVARIGGVAQTGEDWTPHIRNIDNLATEKTLRYMAVEESMRTFDITVDDSFAVPSGSVWYVKSLYITSGQLYLDGDLKVI